MIRPSIARNSSINSSYEITSATLPRAVSKSISLFWFSLSSSGEDLGLTTTLGEGSCATNGSFDCAPPFKLVLA